QGHAIRLHDARAVIVDVWFRGDTLFPERTQRIKTPDGRLSRQGHGLTIWVKQGHDRRYITGVQRGGELWIQLFWLIGGHYLHDAYHSFVLNRQILQTFQRLRWSIIRLYARVDRQTSRAILRFHRQFSSKKDHQPGDLHNGDE